MKIPRNKPQGINLHLPIKRSVTCFIFSGLEIVQTISAQLSSAFTSMVSDAGIPSKKP